MPEIIVKYKSDKTLQVLLDIARYFDFVVETPTIKKNARGKKNAPPIDFAENPDVAALAGIWKDKDVTQQKLRENAWGSRL